MDEKVVVSTHNMTFDVKVTASILSGREVVAKSPETTVSPGMRFFHKSSFRIDIR